MSRPRVRGTFLLKWAKYLAFGQSGATPSGCWGHTGFPFVASLVPRKAKKVLEIGCADGYLLHLLQEKGHEAWGLTFYEEEYLTAKSRGFSVVLGDMHDIPFPDKTFDAVLARHTLEHALALVVVLWECSRVTREGGYLIVHGPNNATGTDDYAPHHYSLTPLQWKHYVKKYGYKSVLSEGVEEAQGSYWLVAQK